MNKYYCYKITNEINDKVYIGITNNPKRRWADHTKYKNKEGGHRPLYRAINKYSSDNFKMDILSERNSWDKICEEEIRYIKKYNSFWTSGKGYNLTTGGQGATNTIISPETKKKLSDNAIRLNTYQSLDKYYKENPEMRSILQKKVMSNPDIVEKIKNKALKQMSDPKNRELSRQGAIKQWENMSEKEKQSRAEGMRQRAIKFNSDPIFKENNAKKRRKKVVAHGVIYESVNACAEKFGVKANTITYRCQNKHNSNFYYKRNNPK